MIGGRTKVLRNLVGEDHDGLGLVFGRGFYMKWQEGCSSGLVSY